MRQHKRTLRTPAPAPMYRATTGLPTNRYALIVDGQAKTEFMTRDRALKAAGELKGRFPMLQIQNFDAENKRSEEMELVAAGSKAINCFKTIRIVRASPLTNWKIVVAHPPSHQGKGEHSSCFQTGK